MSSLSVTTINTSNNITDLTITTGNSATGGMVVYSNGSSVVLKSNSTTNSVFLYSNGLVAIANTVNAAAHTVGTAVVANSVGVTTTGFVNATGAVNAASHTVGATFTANATLVNAAAINITGQTNTATLFVTTSANVGTTVVANSTGINVSANVTATNINATANIQSAVFRSTGNNFVLGNTGTGAFVNAASGYTILPNQVKVNWGTVVTNSVGQNVITFSSAFTTNAYAISAAAISSINSVIITTRTVTATGFTLFSANSTGAATNTGVTSVYYMAIGPA